MSDELIDAPQAEDGQRPGELETTAEPPTSSDDAPPVVSDVEDETDRRSPLPYPVVGIGASAGGVEAYLELFGSLPADTGMAFVVISHLSPDYKSHLVEIIGRVTAMPVAGIAEAVRPEPNHVYVLPAGMYVRLEKGVFRLEERPADGPLRPIDHFFRSLGAEQKSSALGVVLSGADSDGAIGLKMIKGEGGIAIVQTPESARYPDMPRSSISTDHVDRILPPGQIAADLTHLAAHYREPLAAALDSAPASPTEEQHFARILTLLRGVSGIDFRLYKPTTIRRRIARRMMLLRFHTFAQYAAFLQGNSKELRELQEDALINVTRFFRDPGVFETFKEVVLPRIFANRSADQQVRIWVAGCSTGEEVYSLAICLLEYLSGQPLEPSIQIFGTDASDHNIHHARMAVYPESITAEVSPERLRRFFVKLDKAYQVSKRLRDLCIFARQNLCNDPPFSKMDLISCRNVLIYLGTELQKQILPTFHYALRQNGHLLLGVSETIREYTDLFEIVDRRHKFFTKVGASPARNIFTVPAHRGAASPPPAQSPAVVESWGDAELQRAADRLVLARYGPPGIVIDERQEILQSRGHTAPFLEMPQGAVSLNLSRMLRDSIAGRVSEAVRQSIEQDIPVRVEGLQVTDGDAERPFTLEVLPIHTVAARARCFLVLFAPLEDPADKQAQSADPAVGTPESDALIGRLRQELTSTKLYLETLLEERDAKNQELVSFNEEIQSANEELQSTNEELETTKEELQSSNEELQTVNDELQQRNAVLSQTSNDLTNLLNSVNLPVLMLSSGLNIRHFTPPMQRLMNLLPSDVGRPVSDIRLNLNIDDLKPILTTVLESLAPQELEVQDRQGHWYLLRVRPYRTTDNKIDGVVIVVLDIDQLRRSEQELRYARDFSRSVLESVPLPLVAVDLALRIRSANDAFGALVGPGFQPLDGRLLTEVASHAWGMDEPLRRRLEELRATPEPASSFDFEHPMPGDPVRVLNVRGCALRADGQIFLLVTFEDITARTAITRLLGEERERLEREVRSVEHELERTQEDLRALAGNLMSSQEDERRRVARELHDDICQKLAALEICAEQAARQVTGDPASALAEVERVRSGIASLSDDVRTISHWLHPSVIDDLGLVPALRSLVEDFQEREGMIATFSAQKLPDGIPRDVATGLYRIAQEALRNVAKHAGKTHVKVILRGVAGGIKLQVIDAGEGFDVQDRRSGLGLISMEERARTMRGTFQIESELGEGAKVTVQVPWKEENGKQE